MEPTAQSGRSLGHAVDEAAGVSVSVTVSTETSGEEVLRVQGASIPSRAHIPSLPPI
jgi:hypothetical protein